MPEYYLRVSVTELVPAITNEEKKEQYNWFAIYDKDRKSEDVFQWMLADIIRTYKLEAGKVLVEQFNRL